ETLSTIAADPKHLGARIGMTSVLHTWGIGAHPSPARAHHRARGWTVAGWHPVDRLPPRVLSVRAGPVPAVPTAVSRRSDGAASIRRSGLLRRSGRACTGRYLRRLARALPQIP